MRTVNSVRYNAIEAYAKEIAIKRGDGFSLPFGMPLGTNSPLFEEYEDRLFCVIYCQEIQSNILDIEAAAHGYI